MSFTSGRETQCARNSMSCIDMRADFPQWTRQTTWLRARRRRRAAADSPTGASGHAALARSRDPRHADRVRRHRPLDHGRRRGLLAGAGEHGDDLVAPSRPWRENSAVPHEMETRRHQDCEALQQFQRNETRGGGAVAPAVPQTGRGGNGDHIGCDPSVQNSTQSLRNGMEAVDTGGTGGQQNGRRFRKSLKRRPSNSPS